MKQHIRAKLEDLLPLVDLDSDFLFSELDSLGVTTILMSLSEEYGIQLEATDATPACSPTNPLWFAATRR